ncbi:hypothetical protein RJT34_03478 [Clitoria ternatea]|uniref:Uncharacterized protein n=1 Tax=Clitoria ternatea TaxID=43366 RepID=A0AAN9Q199_CLITE
MWPKQSKHRMKCLVSNSKYHIEMSAFYLCIVSHSFYLVLSSLAFVASLHLEMLLLFNTLYIKVSLKLF